MNTKTIKILKDHVVLKLSILHIYSGSIKGKYTKKGGVYEEKKKLEKR